MTNAQQSLTNPDPSVTGPGLSTMRETQILTSIADIELVQEEWETFLRERAGDHNLMQHPDIFKYDLREHSDLYQPMIVILRNGGQIEAVAPWFVHRLRFPIEIGVFKLVRFPLRLLKLAGADMALDREAPVTETFDRIFSAVRDLRKKFDLIALFDVPVSNDLWNYLEPMKQTARPFRVVRAEPEPQAHHRLVLPKTFDDFMASLTSKKRNSLRRHARQLHEAAGNSVTTTRITAPDQVPTFFQDVRQVYRASWQGRTLGGERGTDSQIRFYQHVASHGWYRSFLVRSGTGPISYSLAYQYEGVLYCQEMAYDTAWRDCAPGNYMFISLIKDLYEYNTPRIVDFGAGDSVFKQQFSNETGGAQTAYLAPPRSYYGRAIITTQRIMHALYTGVNTGLTRMGIDRWVRDRVKRRRRSN